jgi:hypothetical protein
MPFVLLISRSETLFKVNDLVWVNGDDRAWLIVMIVYGRAARLVCCRNGARRILDQSEVTYFKRDTGLVKC